MEGRLRFGRVVIDRGTGAVLVDGVPVAAQPLTWRLLAWLVEHPRRLFTREELHEVLWPGVSVTDDSLSQVVRRVRALLPEPEALVTVHRRGYRLDVDVTVEAAAPRLPVPADRFVGRDTEVAALRARLAGADRLVTLIGHAGIGKTRLAIEVARGWSEEARFVDLQAARTQQDLVRSAAEALGVPAASRDPVSEVGVALRALGPALLVLDNLDGVVAVASGPLSRWLGEAPEARWLVTSRVVSGVRGERVVDVLPLPPDEAAALLADRAGGAWSPQDLAPLAEALHGLPLALELVAPRLRLLPPAEILSRLADRAALLRTVGPTDRPERHRSLQAALETSWEPLSDADRRGLCQLVAWVGEFDAEQAEVVLEGEAPLDVLQSLRDQSLVSVRAPGRFHVLPTVRGFVEERGDPEVLARAEVRHGEWLAALGAPDAVLRAIRDPSGPAMAAIARVLDDLVAASRRAAARGDARTAGATAGAASEVLKLRGPVGLAVELLQGALDVTPPTDRERVRAGLARALLVAERIEEALVVQEAALADALATGDPLRIGRAQLQLSFVVGRTGRYEDAERRAAAARELLRQAGDRYHEGLALHTLANCAARRGADDLALQRYEEAARFGRELDDPRLQQQLLNNYGVALQRAGRLDEALASFREAVALHERLGDVAREGSCRGNIGWLLAERGDLEEGLAETREALACTRRVGQPLLEALHLENIGRMLGQLGRHEEALASLDEARALAVSCADPGAEAGVLAALAEVHCDAGRAEAALDLADRAVGLVADHGDVRLRAAAFLARAEAALHAGAIAQAGRDLEAAEALLRAANEQPGLGIACCLRAALRARLGDHDGALLARAEAEQVAARAGLGPRSPLGRRIAALP